MSMVLKSQPYAIYPILFNPYEKPSYKQSATYRGTASNGNHETSTKDHSSEDKIESVDYSTKHSDSLCSMESNVQKSPIVTKRPITTENKTQIDKKPLFKTIKKQLQAKSEVGNNWLLTSKINLIPRPVISSHKPVIPTPNMDLFQVNDFDTSRSCYTSTTTRSISQKQSINKRPYSVGSTNSKLSNQIDSENDTNKTAAYSSYSSRKPFQCLPEKTIAETKKNRPSSAPCILEENDKAASAISELDNTTVNASFTSRQSPTSESDQKLTDQTVNREEEKSDQNSMNSPVIFDKKLLKECRIILEDQYDQALRRYGWRMEVHNDPLNLKSKLLPKRLSYSVKLNLQPVLPQPPKMKKQNIETFFQPTIKIPLPSFTISPDFTSECYNAHRNYLTKKGLWNYATRSYSFAY